MDTPVPDEAQEGVPERLRSARLMNPNRDIREATAAARALGISRGSLFRYESGTRSIPTHVLRRAEAVYGVPIWYLLGADVVWEGSSTGQRRVYPGGAGSVPFESTARWEKIPPEERLELPPGPDEPHPFPSWDVEPPSPTAVAPTGRTFGSEAERISYALGVLDMAGTSNRLAIESANEVSRAISAAAAALIAPVRAPAGDAPAGPSLEELAATHRAVTEAQAAATRPPAAPAAPAPTAATGRRRRPPQ